MPARVVAFNEVNLEIFVIGTVVGVPVVCEDLLGRLEGELYWKSIKLMCVCVCVRERGVAVGLAGFVTSTGTKLDVLIYQRLKLGVEKS